MYLPRKTQRKVYTKMYKSNYGLKKLLKEKEMEAIEKKMERLTKILPDKVTPELSIKSEKGKYIASVSITFIKSYIKGKGVADSPVKAVNQAVDDAVRKYRKFKGRHFDKQGERISEHLAEKKEENISMENYEDYDVSLDISTKITKVSNINPKPMTIDEAVKVIETTGNVFVAFYDVKGDIVIVYKRKDGYGIFRG